MPNRSQKNDAAPIRVAARDNQARRIAERLENTAEAAEEEDSMKRSATKMAARPMQIECEPPPNNRTLIERKQQ